jgi:hypothetical protein
MKRIIMITLLILIVMNIITADDGHPEHGDFEQAEAIINAEIPCDSLSEEQLELLGDYYMEQMHPGEAHTLMDEMMGGEGSESLKAMHIRMAQSLYCGEGGMMDSGMMNTMMGQSSMMDFPNSRTNGGTMNMMSGFGMMTTSGLGYSIYWIINVAIAAFVFGIIFWWTKKLVFNEKKKK